MRSEAARSAQAAELFLARFGAAPDGVWLAPGRANLMGEHTDYNDGFVLPFALSQGTTAAAGYRPDRRLVLCSRQEPGREVELALDDLAPGQVTGWAAYPAGIAWALSAAGYQVPGACIAIDSDLPAGAGRWNQLALVCVVFAGAGGAATSLVPAAPSPWNVLATWLASAAAVASSGRASARGIVRTRGFEQRVFSK